MLIAVIIHSCIVNIILWSITVLGDNPGGSRFSDGTIKLSKYSLTWKNVEWSGKHRGFINSIYL